MQSEAHKLWFTYYPKVYGYYFRRVNVKEDVEDLTSLVLTNFINKITDSSNSIQNPHGYLWRSAHNHLVNYIRAKSKRPAMVGIEGDVIDVIDQDIENHRSQHYKDKIKHIMRCVKNNLEGLDLKIVEEVVMMDKKSVDVAKVFGLTADTTRQKLSRGLKKLRAKCLDLWQTLNN